MAAAAERESQTAQAAADAPASLRSSFVALLGRPARSLATMEIQAHLDDVALRYPVMARRLHACGRSMFGWAEKRNLVPGNPFSDVMMEGREASRERMLTDAEIAAVWNAAGAMPYPFGPFLRLFLLTLQRRNEVGGDLTRPEYLVSPWGKGEEQQRAYCPSVSPSPADPWGASTGGGS